MCAGRKQVQRLVRFGLPGMTPSRGWIEYPILTQMRKSWQQW